jgi:mRNA-degrading endonuclease RelE of RelBE toxin-antitoxin system
MARVLLTREAAKGLEALPLAIHVRVLSLFERLAKWPNISGAKPLSGPLTGRYRIRTGDYRVQFRVEGQTIVVEKIGHRDGFYERG